MAQIILKHGFLVSAYDNPLQLIETINVLEDPRSVFYIHVDKKSRFYDISPVFELRKKPNVFFIEDRLTVSWAGFSHLRALFLLIDTASKDHEICYFHAITDSCYPLKSKAQFFSFFEMNSGKEFIENFALPSPMWTDGGLDRIQYFQPFDLFNNTKSKFFWELNRRLISLQKKLRIKRSLPKIFDQYYGGITWWSLSKNAILYIIQFHKQHPSFLNRFKYTFCAEEIYFHTILLNSDFERVVENNCLRYIDWGRRNGSEPANLDLSDFTKITGSGALFARKFKSPVSDELLGALKRTTLLKDECLSN